MCKEENHHYHRAAAILANKFVHDCLTRTVNLGAYNFILWKSYSRIRFTANTYRGTDELSGILFNSIVTSKFNGPSEK